MSTFDIRYLVIREKYKQDGNKYRMKSELKKLKADMGRLRINHIPGNHKVTLAST